MIWVNICMGYIKDPPAPVPEYIRIGDRRWPVRDLLQEQPRRGVPSPKGNMFQFVLCEPFTQWPVGLTKFANPQNVAQKPLNGDMYQWSLIMTPDWYYKSSRRLTMTVPFIAVKQMYIKPQQSYWQFYFRTEAEMLLAVEQSPAAQWLAIGHRLPAARIRKPQDDTNDILSAYRSRGQDRLQRDQRGRSQLDNPVSIQDTGENGYIIQHHK